MIAPAVPADQEATRARLMEAAGAVFAEQGFRGTTVREICARAGANVAAVNYHFRDKMGLYVAVIKGSMGSEGPHDPRRLGLEQMPAEEALRAFVAGMLHRVLGGDRPAWHLRIMAHEMTQPTEALPRVAEEVIGPNYAILRGVLARVLGMDPAHDTVRLCAHSIVGQVVHYALARPAIAILWPAMKMTPPQVEQIARHIAEFSLGGIRELARNIGRKPGRLAAQASGKEISLRRGAAGPGRAGLLARQSSGKRRHE